MVPIRLANINDLPAIVTIYNQAIQQKFLTADTKPFSVIERIAWFEKFDERYPLFVYTIDDIVVGWASISPYRPGRQALRHTVELSYYVHQDHKSKGIGTALIKHALGSCKTLGYKNVITIILDRNEPSIRLMQKLGFEQWAYLPFVADFDGVECGHVYFGLRIS